VVALSATPAGVNTDIDVTLRTAEAATVG